MPGREYVASIRDFWRVCSGCDARARERVVKFLTEVLNTKQFPLTVLDRPIESETAKIVENSYRATTLAFLNEWSLFSERNGVDLTKVIKAIKVRPTHSNMIFPGPGIGGYCLPKDGGLGYWAYRHILGFDDGDQIFKMSTTAIDINDTRGLHVADADARRAPQHGSLHRGRGGRSSAARATARTWATRGTAAPRSWYGGSPRWAPTCGSTIRTSSTGASSRSRTTYPAPGHSLARFFRNQEHLTELRIQQDLKTALHGVEAVILAVPHEPYLALEPDDVVRMAGGPLAVIDCFGILDDDKIRRYFELGCEVKGLGRGHIQRIKQEVQDRGQERPQERAQSR